jgi:Outer membrane protein beta-barrel domain
MRPLPPRWLPAFAFAVIALPGRASAEPHIRNGLCLGVGFGLQSISWEDEEGNRTFEDSGVFNARAGWAVEQDVVLGVEFWGWAKTYEISTLTLPVPVDILLSATTLGLTYFPGNAGFYVRLGAGLAYGRIDVTPPPAVDFEPAGSQSETGIAVALAPGYEWRFTPHFALGAQGDVVYLALKDVAKNAYGYGVNAQFDWYW